MRDFTGVPGAAGGLADDDTRWTPEVGNAIVQEIANVITDPGGGNTPLDPGDNTQLLAAIKAIVEGGFASPDTETEVFRSGRLLKCVTSYGAYAEGTYFIGFATPFPNACQTAVVTAHNAGGSVLVDTWAQVVDFNAAGVYVGVQSRTAGLPNLSGLTVWAKGS